MRAYLIIFGLLSVIVCQAFAQYYTRPTYGNIQRQPGRSLGGGHAHSKTLEQAYADLKKTTQTDCIRLTYCMIGAEDKLFNHFGEMVSAYYRDKKSTIPEMTNMSEVYRVGQQTGKASDCRARMGTTCKIPDTMLINTAKNLV